MENHIHTCFESILWLAIRKSPPHVIQTNGFYSETQNLFLAGCLYSNQSHNDQHLFNGKKQTPTSLYNESDVSDDANNDEYIDANIVINEYRYMFVEYLYRLPSADVNFRDHFTGQSALHYACKTKDYELLQILLEVSDIKVDTMEMKQENQEEVEETELDGDNDKNNANMNLDVNKSFASPEHKILNLNLQIGSHIGSSNYFNETALHLLVFTYSTLFSDVFWYEQNKIQYLNPYFYHHQQVEERERETKKQMLLQMIGLLLERGAKVNILNHENSTVLHIAACSLQLDLVTLLLSNAEDNDLFLFDSCNRNPVGCVVARICGLVDEWNVSYADAYVNEGFSSDYHDIHQNPNVNQRADNNNNDNGDDLSLQENNEEIEGKGHQKITLRFRNNQLVKRKNMEATKYRALERQRIAQDIIEMFYSFILMLPNNHYANYKADDNYRKTHTFRQLRSLFDVHDKESNTVLDYCCIYNMCDLAQFLYSSGASRWVEDKYGYTPLHKACQYASVEFLKIFLAEPSDTRQKAIEQVHKRQYHYNYGNYNNNTNNNSNNSSTSSDDDESSFNRSILNDGYFVIGTSRSNFST